MLLELDQTISVQLKRDEAIVLLWYLSREIWNEDHLNLAASFIDPAEPHTLTESLRGGGEGSIEGRRPRLPYRTYLCIGPRTG